MEENKVETLMQRLEDAAASLEGAAARLAEQQIALAARAEETGGERIIATADTDAEQQRMADLEQDLAQRLQKAEARLDALSATAAPEAGRKTAPAGAAMMLSRQGGDVATLAAGAVDGALATLSIEQRIAVKAELLRAGLIG